jgi:hypothetical protein
MKNFYYVDDIGEVQGPLTPQELEALHRSGRVTATTQVCEEGTENWRPYYQAAGEPASAPPPLPKVIVQQQPQQEVRMSGFGFDAAAIAAQGRAGDMYVVLQVVLTEKFFGTGSGVSSLTNLQATINNQVAKVYKLHTISTTSSGSKGFLGGDKIQATMVFEKVL